MTSNPMSAASKAGLLKRMYADGADTFAKKVKWVAKHIPTITDPQAYVGWLTREERTSMATRNPTYEQHIESGQDDLDHAKQLFEFYEKAKSKPAKLNKLWDAHRVAICCQLEYESANAMTLSTLSKEAKQEMKEAREIEVKAKSLIENLLSGGSVKAKNPAARSTAEMQHRKAVKKAAMQHRKAVKKAAMHEAKVAGRAARAAKKASGHNYVVCDSHGKAVALTTTLAEARKTVPKGGCIEKI